MNATLENTRILAICNECQCEILRGEQLYTIDIGEKQAIYLCEECGNELTCTLDDLRK